MIDIEKLKRKIDDAIERTDGEMLEEVQEIQLHYMDGKLTAYRQLRKWLNEATQQ